MTLSKKCCWSTFGEVSAWARLKRVDLRLFCGVPGLSKTSRLVSFPTHQLLWSVLWNLVSFLIPFCCFVTASHFHMEVSHDLLDAPMHVLGLSAWWRWVKCLLPFVSWMEEGSGVGITSCLVEHWLILQKKDLRGASQVVATSSWIVRGDGEEGPGRQVEEQTLLWLVSSFLEPVKEEFY